MSAQQWADQALQSFEAVVQSTDGFRPREGQRSMAALVAQTFARAQLGKQGEDADPPERAIAVVQAGYRNRFGHPAAEVAERYRALDVAWLVSPACGAWQWRSDESEPGRCQREIARRYWHRE